MLALTLDVVLWWVPVILLMLADSNSKLIIARVAQCVLFPERKTMPCVYKEISQQSVDTLAIQIF